MGEIYPERYEAVNAMLLNEFLKEHREVQVDCAVVDLQRSVVVNDAPAVAAKKSLPIQVVLLLMVLLLTVSVPR